MSRTKRDKLWLACSRVTALLLLQQTVVADDIIEEIEITAIRHSIQAARDMKRNSSNIVDAIIAEDIGKMADQNVAEALQRVTGVAISRENGEGAFVTIRGIDPSLNNVTINGQSLTNGGDGSAFNFNALSADMLQSIEVVKTASADQDEGSLGGTVNLKTVRPLDQKDRLTFELQGRENSIAEEIDYAVKAGYSRKFNENDLGIAASFFYDPQVLRRDGFTAFGYQVGAFPGAVSLQTGQNVNRAGITEADDDGDGLNDIDGIFPRFVVDRAFESERVRIGGTFTVQWQPNDDTDLWADLTYSEHKVQDLLWQARVNRFERTNTQLVAGGTAGGNPGQPLVGEYMFDENTRTFVRGLSNRTSAQILARSQEIETETFAITVGGQRLFDQWTAETNLGFSSSEQTWPENLRLNYLSKAANTQGGYDFGTRYGDNELPVPLFGSTPTELDPNAMRLTQIFDDSRDVTDDKITLRIDLDREFDNFGVTLLEFGGKYSYREKDRSQTVRTVRFGDFPSGEILLSAVAQAFPFDNYLDDLGGPGQLRDWTTSSFDAVFAMAMPADFERTTNPLETWTIEESVVAAYTKANFENAEGRLKGDFGIRVISTEVDAKGTSGFDFPGPPDTDPQVPVSDSHGYTNILPSLNLRHLLDEDKMLRFSAAKVIARPDFNDLRPGFTVRATNVNAQPTATGGNVDLDPFEAWQYDLSAEWYFQETGMIGLALFYKDIDTFVATRLTEEQFTDPRTGECLRDLSAGIDPNTGVAPCAIVGFLTATNPGGDGADILGLEFSYQQDFTFLPGFLNGLGVVTNYTYADSEADYGEPELDDFPFLNTSKHTANFTAYWENDDVSLRLAYNWRSDSLNRALDRGFSWWNEERGSLDFSVNYRLTDNVSLTFQAVNLTDEYDRIYATLSQLPDRVVGTGRGPIGLVSEGNAQEDSVPTFRTLELNQTGRFFRLGVRGTF